MIDAAETEDRRGHSKGARQVTCKIKAFVIFTAYTVIFLLTEYALYGRFAEVFGKDSVTVLYSLLMFMNGGGYLLFPALSRLISDEGRKNKILAAAAVLFFVSAVTVAAISLPAAVIISAFIYMITGGYLGGAVLYAGAVLLRGSGAEGRVFAVATAAATIMQFPIQNYAGTYVRLAAVAAGVVILLTAALPLPQAKAAPSRGAGRKYTKELVAAAVIVLLLSYYYGIADAILMKLNAEGKISVVGWPRLVYVAGILLAGVVADMKKGRYFNAVILAVTSITAVYPLFLGNGFPYHYSHVILWFFCGFYVVSLCVPFLRLSVKSGFPELWAGMGRSVKQFVNGFSVILAVQLLGFSGSGWVVWCNAAVITAITALSFLRLTRAEGPGSADDGEPHGPESTNEANDDKPDKERLDAFALRYGLTEREIAVLEQIIINDAVAKEIGEALGISERTCQRAVTAIYDKTQARTRAAVLILFHEEK